MNCNCAPDGDNVPAEVTAPYASAAADKLTATASTNRHTVFIINSSNGPQPQELRTTQRRHPTRPPWTLEPD